MEQKIKIFVIEMLTFEVVNNEYCNRKFIGKKAIMAERNKETAEQTIVRFREAERKNREIYEDVYHLEFDYTLQEVTLY